jgi:hypothetical protein
LERLTALDGTCQGLSDMRHKSAPVLPIPQRPCSQLSRSQIEVSAGKFRMVTHGLTGLDRVFSDHSCSFGVIEEFGLLQGPAISIGGHRTLRWEPAVIPFLTSDRHRVPSGALHDYVIANLRLRQ